MIDLTAIENDDDYVRNKDAWISVSRQVFEPSKREPCKVCNRYRSLTHAHHLTPLSVQFAREVEVADDAHVWLCPTHHAAVHIFINHIRRPTGSRLTRTCIDLVNGLSRSELTATLEIAHKAF